MKKIYYIVALMIVSTFSWNKNRDANNGNNWHEETKYTYTYTPIVDNSQENRTWNGKMYYLLISSSELSKNKKVIQNPGY